MTVEVNTQKCVCIRCSLNCHRLSAVQHFQTPTRPTNYQAMRSRPALTLFCERCSATCHSCYFISVCDGKLPRVRYAGTFFSPSWRDRRWLNTIPDRDPEVPNARSIVLREWIAGQKNAYIELTSGEVGYCRFREAPRADAARSLHNDGVSGRGSWRY